MERADCGGKEWFYATESDAGVKGWGSNWWWERDRNCDEL